MEKSHHDTASHVHCEALDEIKMGLRAVVFPYLALLQEIMHITESHVLP